VLALLESDIGVPLVMVGLHHQHDLPQPIPISYILTMNVVSPVLS